MITTEELRGKLSLDTSLLGQAKREISDFADTGRSGFVRMEDGARKFRDVLDQITRQSPLLGTALTAALSPVTAILTAAAAGITVVSTKLEAFNKQLDATGIRNARATTDIQAMNAAVRERQEAVARGAEAFFVGQAGQGNPILDSLQKEQAKRKVIADQEKQRRDDAFTAEQRQIEDNFKLRKQRLDEYFTYRELLGGALKGPARELYAFNLGRAREYAGSELDSEQTAATRQTQDRHTARERAAAIVERQKQRQILMAHWNMLGKSSDSAATDLLTATAAAQDPQFAAQLFKAQEEKRRIESELSEVTAQRAASMQAQAAEDTNWMARPGWWLNIALGTRLGGKAQALYNAGDDRNRAELETRYRRLILEQKQNARTVARLTHEDAGRSDALKVAQDRAGQLNQTRREIERQLQTLGLDASGAVEIDNSTGGIAYHGLAQKGGIAYKPIKGAPGFNVSPSTSRPDTRSQINDMVREFVKALGGQPDGMPVSIVNVKDDSA